MSSMIDNLNARRRLTMTFEPDAPEVTLGDVLTAASDLDRQFGKGAGNSLAARYNATSPNKVWVKAYAGYVRYAKAAMWHNVHPGDKSWTVGMLCDYDAACAAGELP